MQLFLSYASEDRQIAEQIQLALIGAGHDVFFDRESLPPGGDYHARIQSAIQESDIFVFLISPDSVVQGSFALTELKYARTKWPHPKARVVPVILRPTAWDGIPNYLKAVTVLEPEGSVAAEVVTAVAALAGDQKRRPPRHRLQVLIALIASLGLLGAVLIAYRNKIFEQPQLPPTAKGCSISGKVFDRDKREPLPGVIISFHHYTEDVRKSRQVRFDAATTGLDGSFKANCQGILDSEFPLRIVLSHPNWKATHLTAQKVELGEERTELNIPVAIRNTDLRFPSHEERPPVSRGPIVLAAPLPKKPECGSVIPISSISDGITFSWQPVEGASVYTVEVDCFGCSEYEGTWYSLAAGRPWHIRTGLGLRSPIYSSRVDQLIRKARGHALRWRVWGMNQEGKEGAETDWCQFAFSGRW
jgi:hypothetical protein